MIDIDRRIYTDENMIGKTFGRLTVMYEAEPRYHVDGHRRRYWHCECSCNNHTEGDYEQNALVHGRILSCGCYGKERRVEGKRANISQNTFELKGDYYIVKDNTGKEFYIDIADKGLIDQRYWYVRKSDGYVYSHNYDPNTKKDNKIALHTQLTNEKYVDHINRNPADNRRCNLRIPDKETMITSNQGYNSLNHTKRSDNHSGFTGVCWNTAEGKWMAYIGVNYKTIGLGLYSNKEDAIKARKDAELKYYGDYSFSQSQLIAKNFEEVG